MDLLFRDTVAVWVLSLLVVLVLLVGPGLLVRLQHNCNLKRRAQEARAKEFLELLAPAPEDTCHDLVGCIMCRFDLEGHKS